MREGDIPPGNARLASRLRMQIGERWRDYLLLLILSSLLWGLHLIWLSRDTRPPVWDMALHQTYALNYLPGAGISASIPYWDWSGNYPPFVQPRYRIHLSGISSRPSHRGSGECAGVRSC